MPVNPSPGLTVPTLVAVQLPPDSVSAIVDPPSAPWYVPTAVQVAVAGHETLWMRTFETVLAPAGSGAVVGVQVPAPGVVVAPAPAATMTGPATTATSVAKQAVTVADLRVAGLWAAGLRTDQPERSPRRAVPNLRVMARVMADPLSADSQTFEMAVQLQFRTEAS